MTDYQPKHRGEPKPEAEVDVMCDVCRKRPKMSPGSPGIGGALCRVCYYEL